MPTPTTKAADETKPATKKISVDVESSSPPKKGGNAEPLVVKDKPAGKEETRLYQTSPTLKEWLTKERALELGFPWT